MENSANQISLNFSAPPVNANYHLTGLDQDAIIQMALNILSQRNAMGEVLTEPSTTANYLRIKLSGYKNEVFCALFNNRHRIIAFEELFFGTIDGAAVYPRVVVQRAIEHNAAAVIFAHYVARNIMRIMCPVSLCGTSH